MTRDESEVVSAMRHELAERIGQARYQLWFNSAVRLEANGLELRVLVAQPFILERIRKQFASDLKSVAQRLLGASAGVHFAIDATLVTTSPTNAEANAGGAAPQAAENPAEEAPLSVEQQQLAASPQTLDGPPTVPLTTAPLHGAKKAGRRFAQLDSYVVGEGNRLAWSAARSAATRTGLLTPLFLYGPTGCGKTHLLEGIYRMTRRHNRSARALFLSAEQFTSYFLEALRNGGLPSFRRRTRDVDLLVIDDLQFFAGKRATTIELQNTIDTLVREQRQLVLAADRPPVALTELGSEFAARISGGLACGIDEADFETRLGIARGLAASGRVAIPDDVLELICSELPGDGRQLAGALNRLEATSIALEAPVDLDLARTALQDIFHATSRIVRLSDIERAVCGAFGISSKTLRDERRSRAASHPRMLAMWLARKHTQAASSEISQYFGRRSHSTVISAERKVNRWVADGATVCLGNAACKVSDAIRRAELHLRSG